MPGIVQEALEESAREQGLTWKFAQTSSLSSAAKEVIREHCEEAFLNVFFEQFGETQSRHVETVAAELQQMGKLPFVAGVIFQTLPSEQATA